MGSYGQFIDGHEVIKKVYPVESPWRNIKPKFELRDCPKCGARMDGWVGYCRDCMCRTEFFQTDEEAANKWNEGDVK